MSMDNLTLLPANNADYDFLYHLHTLTMKTYVEALWGWDEAQQVQIFRERFSPERTQIVQWQGEDMGVLVLEERESEWFISSIQVAPEYQNRGIGTYLIRQIQSKAASDGKAVTLRVLNVNPARRLYERLGFVVTEQTDVRCYMRWEAEETHSSQDA
jgi:ribosomal protein S18 acetylase RimI-like enzyme